MPTPRGYAVLAAGLALGVAGWALGYPELAVLSTGCLAALAVSGGWLLAGFSLRITREIAPVKVQRGDPAIATVRVANIGRRATRPLVAVDRCGGQEVAVPLPGITRGAARFASYRLPTARRGEIAVGPLLVRSGDPLGLFGRVRVYGDPATLLVRPRTAPLPVLASGRAASLEGPTSDTAPSGTVTFHALREYVLGDDLRHIHWRTTARTGTLMVRQLVDSSLPVTVVVLDTRPASYRGDDFDIAVDAAATVATGMATAGFPVTLLTSDGGRLDARSPRGAQDLLDWLARLRASADGELGAALEVARRLTTAASLTVVTGTAPDLPSERLAAVSRAFDRTTVIRAGLDPGARPVLPLAYVDAASAEDVAAAWRRQR
jgi:uncharacterized protein (DUF58 family)